MTRRRLCIESLILAGVTAALLHLLWNNGQRVFDFFDMSAFLDAGYRVWKGQRPYVDFFYLAGPVHLYMHAFFFQMFGFTKAAVLAHFLSTTALVVAMTYTLARRTLSASESLLLALLSGFAFGGPASHPWYDANASFWLMIGIVLHALVPAGAGAVRVRRTAAAAGVAAALAFLAKANVGVAGFAMLVVAQAMKHGWRRAWPGLAAGFAAVFLLVFGLRESFAEYFRQNFLAYPAADRILQVDRLRQSLLETPYLLLLAMTALVAAVGGMRFVRDARDELIVLAGMTLTSLFASYTGSMFPAANLSLLGFESAYLWICARKARAGSEGGRARGTAAAEILVALAAVYWLYVAAAQTGRLATWQWRDRFTATERNVSDYPLRAAGFEGWRCNGRIGRGVDETADYIRASIPRDETLLVLPDATILYGLTERESFRGAPFLFHRGQAPPPGIDMARFRAIFASRPPDWIVWHRQREIPWMDERLLPWLGIDRELAENYEPTWAADNFVIFRRKPESSAPSASR